MAKNKYIESPEKLLELFKEYVKHEAENPMYKLEYVGKEGRLEKTPIETPVTFEGFEVYLFQKQIINDLGDYSSNKGDKYSEYSTIITYIRKHCYVHNFKGAAVGLFNPNLVARKLGLTDKIENTVIEQPIFNLDELSNNDSNTEDL
jgi:hypothetical protein